jgi:hypothetical protein
MKLKDQPKVKDNWPPSCHAAFYGRGLRMPTSTEQFNEAIIIEANLSRNGVYLIFEYDNNKGSFTLTFADLDFEKNFVRFVNDNKGKTFGKLLDMEIGF